MSFATVAVPRPVRRLFTYAVPPRLAARCRKGVRAVVPFGRGRLTGYVVDVGTEPPASSGASLKEIEEVLDPEPVLDAEVLELTRWAADYYAASWGATIRSALPGMQAVPRRAVALTAEGQRALAAGGGVLVDAALPRAARDPLGREILGAIAAADRGPGVLLEDLRRRVGPRFRRPALAALGRAGLVVIGGAPPAAGLAPRREEHAALADAADAAAPRGPRQRRILEVLRAAGGRLPVAALLREAGATRASLRPLVAGGRVTIDAVESSRRPFLIEPGPDDAAAPRPTPDQERAIAVLRDKVAAGGFSTCLLRGVTGSGKTEVYLHAIAAALRASRRALYLVPEIGLTPLLARRLRARFGEVLALLHSGLSPGERFDEWRRIRRGDARVVLGARSAVFAPIPDLGLIVVDEEHDASYKQDEYPRYSGRDLAVLRGRMAAATVVLGSATPSVESYHHARRGRYALLELENRIGSAGMPRVERVDMRREFAEVGRESILSRRLLAAVRDRLARREQSLILLNRRGFSTFALCRACGTQVECRRCSIAMTLHLKEKRLRCHYCDASRTPPEACPECGSAAMHYGGTGTERLEAAVAAAFPEARTARLDRDAVRGRRGSVEAILTAFERGAIDILLGTQMIAKGHDFPNVTLVGVLAADALLGLPDFRAAERTYQLLAQVAGRSGRGDLSGEVLVQAYDADHHAIRAACDHDYPGFATRELAFRRVMNYPPYSALAMILIKDRDAPRGAGIAAAVAAALRTLASPSLQILGPAPAPLERLRGEHRVQVLVKAASRTEMQRVLAELPGALAGRKVQVDDLVIDVDPISTL